MEGRGLTASPLLGRLGEGSMMEYHVRVISDNELPIDVTWAFVRREEQLEFWLTRAVMQRPEMLETALEEAWFAYRGIKEKRLMSWPPLASAG